MNKLEGFIPEESIKQVQGWIDELDVILRIVSPRRSKSGDFKVIGRRKSISINNNLNQYSFLITLTHELAHAFVYRDYKNKVYPHGNEWKRTFKLMLLNFISSDCFPDDILRVLSLYMKNPKASTSSDIELSLVLKRYDDTDVSLLLNIKEGKEFSIYNDRVFIKGRKLRKRYKCIDRESNMIYSFHPLTEVNLIQK